MKVTAPNPASAVTELLKVTALPLPHAGADPALRAPDEFVLTPEPTLQALVHLAAAGRHNLATLLPILQRMLVANPSPFPLGHLTRAVGDAAHWVDAGAAGLPRTDTTELTPAWRQITRVALHDAADLLARAERQLETIPQPTPHPDTIWAMSQIAGAQRQVALALGTLSAPPRPAAATPTRRPTDITRTIARFGTALLLILFVLVYGTWLTVAALAGSIVALAWVWRIVILSRDLKLEIRR